MYPYWKIQSSEKCQGHDVRTDMAKNMTKMHECTKKNPSAHFLLL